MNLETAKKQLLFDAAKNKNLIFVAAKSDGPCVKGYSAPHEWRHIYVAALDALQCDGFVKPIFNNRELQFFMVTPLAPAMPSLQSAKQRILQELQTNGFIYKIHGTNGEFVQCVDENFEDFESTRILYNCALSELMRSGAVDVVQETREMCTYALPKILPAQNTPIELERRDPLSPMLPLELCA